jgi:hypothetical protein
MEVCGPKGGGDCASWEPLCDGFELLFSRIIIPRSYIRMNVFG